MVPALAPVDGLLMMSIYADVQAAGLIMLLDIVLQAPQQQLQQPHSAAAEQPQQPRPAAAKRPPSGKPAKLQVPRPGSAGPPGWDLKCENMQLLVFVAGGSLRQTSV